jgi:hypothetical protein
MMTIATVSAADDRFLLIDLNAEIQQFLGSHRHKNLYLLLLRKPNM